MLRKLIAIALTTGLAKKAWDKYQQDKAGQPAADAGKPARKAAPARRRTKAAAKPE